MFDINGEAPPLPDATRLPYAKNGGAGPQYLIPLTVLFSIVTLALNFFGVTALPLYVVLGPPVLLALHVISFTRTRNAVHMALTAHTHDERVTQAVIDRIEAIREGQLSKDRLAYITRNLAK